MTNSRTIWLETRLAAAEIRAQVMLRRELADAREEADRAEAHLVARREAAAMEEDVLASRTDDQREASYA